MIQQRRLAHLLILGLISGSLGSLVVKNHGADRSPSCFQGPEYWCKDLRTAKDCVAIKHCSQTVWPHMKLPEDNEDICQICKEMVQEARDQLMSNETQEELREVFEGTCKLIPVKAIRKECMTLADDFVPELVDLLASQMNPQMVCATAGLCNSARINQMWLDFKNAKESSYEEDDDDMEKTENGKNPIPGGCEDCHRFVDDTRTIVETHSKEEVLERLLYICDQAEGFSDPCKYIVTQNFPQIYEILISLDSDQICKTVGMCEDSLALNVKVVSKSQPAKAVKIGDGLECEFCEAMVNHVRDIMNSTTTEEEFMEVAEGICHASRMEDKCLALVHRYYRVVYAFIVNEMHPREMCAAIGLCKDAIMDRPLWIPIMGELKDMELTLASIIRPQSVLPLTKLEPAQPVGFVSMTKMVPAEPVAPYEKKDVAELLSMFPASLVGGDETFSFLGGDEEKNKPFCSICELVMHDVEVMLANTTEDKKIEDLVRRVCDRLPKSLSGQCDAFISQYGDAILFVLAQQLDPSIVCPRLNLCLEVELSNDVEYLPELKSSKKHLSDMKDCALCHFAVEELEKRIREPRTKEDIKRELEGICIRLPPALRRECEDFVRIYTPRLIDLLLDEYSPEKICIALKMCEPGPHPPPPPKVEEKNKPFCSICELVMRDVEEMLSNTTEDKKIEDLVRHVCNRLPESVRGQCNQFITEWGDAILAVLAEQMDPSIVCPKLNLCDTNEISNEIDAEWKAPETKVSDFKDCALCHLAVKEIEKRLQNKKTQEEIEHEIEQVCTRLPATLRDECDDFVRIYSPQLIELLIAEYTPEKICIALKMCSPKEPRELTLGEFLQKVKSEPVTPPVEKEQGTVKKESSVNASNPLCVMCEFAMAKIDKILITNATEEDIRKAVRNVCYIMPKTVELQCLSFLELYGGQVIDLLIRRMAPEEICKLLNVCILAQEDDVSVHMNRCEICEVAVEYFDTLLEDDTIEENIDQILGKVCNIIPERNRPQCRAMIDTYGPYIVSLIGQLANSHEVCSALDLCQKQGLVRLLGGEQCKLGPAYWCVSEKHAKACGELKYCESIVWKKN